MIYSSASLESLYLKDGKYVLGELIKSFIRIVSAGPGPYTVDAPAMLITNLAVNEGQWILHMTNWTGNKFERLYVDDNYLAPVENVRLELQVPDNKKIRSVSTFVKMPYEIKSAGAVVQIKIPRLDAYQAVQVDFE